MIPKRVRNFILAISGTLFLGTAFAQNPCDVINISHNPDFPVLWSPDSSRYLVNVPDTAGVFQIFVGNAGDTNMTCISLNNPLSLWRPWVQRNKLQVQWSPTGNFIICAVEKEFYPELLYVPYNLRLGWLESGIWMDIMATTPDGNTWYNLANTIKGFTGPAFTPNGNQCAWAEAQDTGSLAVNVFGVWRLQLSNYTESSGTPAFTSTADITPIGARWIEPGNFSPDGHSLLVSSDIGITNAEGQDQFIVDIVSGQVTNLNNTPMVWDEHGVFSPDGSKILFMSSYPYQADTNSYHTLTIKTEFMLMNPNGTGLQQLTHLCDTGYVESGGGIAATGIWGRGDSTIFAQSLMFPDYDNWIIKFYGDCGYTPTGINENTENDFHIYPNPANDKISIETAVVLEDAQLIITNSLGQTIKIISGVNGNQVNVDVENLVRGIYFLQIENDQYHVVRKFVKE